MKPFKNVTVEVSRSLVTSHERNEKSNLFDQSNIHENSPNNYKRCPTPQTQDVN